MNTSISPMKHSKVNKSIYSHLDSLHKQKHAKLKRVQDRKNKRLKMALGA